jgi:hypothetical protein
VIHRSSGLGCSDRFSPGDVAPLEVQVDDLIKVMDAAGSEQPFSSARWDTGLAAMLFAATNPGGRQGWCSASFATYCATEETPWMYSEARWEEIAVEVRANWGTSRWNWKRKASPMSGRPWTGSCRGHERASRRALVAESRAFITSTCGGSFRLFTCPLWWSASERTRTGKTIWSRTRGSSRNGSPEPA